jgi:hypothetical protein
MGDFEGLSGVGVLGDLLVEFVYEIVILDTGRLICGHSLLERSSWKLFIQISVTGRQDLLTEEVRLEVIVQQNWEEHIFVQSKEETADVGTEALFTV